MIRSRTGWIVALAILAVGLAILIVLLASRGRPSDEDRIRSMFLQAEQDANARNAAGLLSIVSHKYRDAQGYDYSMIRSLLAGWRGSSERMRVTVYDLKMEIQGKKALVKALVTVRFDATTRLEVPLTVELAKEKRNWRVTSTAGWQGTSFNYGF